MTIISYVNGSFMTSIDTDGTKIREKLDNKNVVLFPESIDLKITDWCDAGCAWCHENSTVHGRHADLKPILDILSDLPRGVEIAIGGGHPLAHPNIVYFLKKLKDFGLIANITINEFHFQKQLSMIKNLADEKLINGIGYSYSSLLPEWDNPNIVIHFILGVHNPEIIEQQLKNYSHRAKILLLGFKNYGRGKLYNAPQKEITKWFRYLPSLVKYADIAFDTLGIEQINPKRLFVSQEKYNEYFMGKEGEFSMYIDAVKNQYAVSSFSKERHEICSINDMFRNIRKEAFA